MVWYLWGSQSSSSLSVRLWDYGPSVVMLCITVSVFLPRHEAGGVCGMILVVVMVIVMMVMLIVAV